MRSIGLLILRWYLRLFFTLGACAVLFAVMIWSFHLWEQWFPGILGRAAASRGGELAMFIAAPVTFLAFYLWWSYFKWIDRMFDAEKGPLAKVPDEVKTLQLPPDKAGICVYFNETFATRLTVPVLLDGAPVGTLTANTHVFREVDPGKHVVIARFGKEASLAVEVRAGVKYYIQWDTKYKLLETLSRLRLVDEAAGIALMEKGRRMRSLMIAGTAIAALAVSGVVLRATDWLSSAPWSSAPRNETAPQARIAPDAPWLNTAEYQQEFNAVTRGGEYPYVVEGRCEAGILQFRADWRTLPHRTTFLAYAGMTREDYEQRNKEYGARGYHLGTLKQFRDCTGNERYSATWLN
jgi:hypothetical protein